MKATEGLKEEHQAAKLMKIGRHEDLHKLPESLKVGLFRVTIYFEVRKEKKWSILPGITAA